MRSPSQWDTASGIIKPSGQSTQSVGPSLAKLIFWSGSKESGRVAESGSAYTFGLLLLTRQFQPTL
jgi:hypothetical protein